MTQWSRTARGLNVNFVHQRPSQAASPGKKFIFEQPQSHQHMLLREDEEVEDLAAVRNQ